MGDLHAGTVVDVSLPGDDDLFAEEFSAVFDFAERTVNDPHSDRDAFGAFLIIYRKDDPAVIGAEQYGIDRQGIDLFFCQNDIHFVEHSGNHLHIGRNFDFQLECAAG